MTHTTRAVRAAEHIYLQPRLTHDIDVDTFASIIDTDTHVAEMLTFIDKVAEGDFGSPSIAGSFYNAQQEAFARIKKWLWIDGNTFPVKKTLKEWGKHENYT